MMLECTIASGKRCVRQSSRQLNRERDTRGRSSFSDTEYIAPTSADGGVLLAVQRVPNGPGGGGDAQPRLQEAQPTGRGVHQHVDRRPRPSQCVCLSVCLSLSLYLSLSHTHIHTNSLSLSHPFCSCLHLGLLTLSLSLFLLSLLRQPAIPHLTFSLFSHHFCAPFCLSVSSCSCFFVPALFPGQIQENPAATSMNPQDSAACLCVPFLVRVLQADIVS